MDNIASDLADALRETLEVASQNESGPYIRRALDALNRWEAHQAADTALSDSPAPAKPEGAVNAELLAAAKEMEDLYLSAAPNVFANGVTDSAGSIDEGEVRAGECVDRLRTAIRKAEAALSAPSPREGWVTEAMVDLVLEVFRLKKQEYDFDFRGDEVSGERWRAKYGTNLHSTGLGERWAMRAALEAALSAAPSPQGREGRAIAEIAAERRRQIEAEGWTPAHDDKHRQGELAHAAACYALSPRSWGLPMRPVTEDDIADFVNRIWPWWNEYDDGGRIYSRTKAWWKPKDRRRDLIRAGALIAAEIDRLDRLAAPHGTEEGR